MARPRVHSTRRLAASTLASTVHVAKMARHDSVLLTLQHEGQPPVKCRSHKVWLAGSMMSHKTGTMRLSGTDSAGRTATPTAIPAKAHTHAVAMVVTMTGTASMLVNAPSRMKITTSKAVGTTTAEAHGAAMMANRDRRATPESTPPVWSR